MKKLLCTASLALWSACSTPAATSDAPTGNNPDAPPTNNPDAPTSNNPDAPGGAVTGWRSIPMPENQQEARVTGILCSSRSACVVATQNFGDPGEVLAATDHDVGAVLVNGNDVSSPAHVLGDVGFIGIDKTRNGAIARADVAGAIVSANGDFTKAASWSIVDDGRQDGDPLPLNAQDAVQFDANGNWLMIYDQGYVTSATVAPASALPSSATTWTPLWSPTATPAVPADFEDRFALDMTLCDSEVSTGIQPTGTQNVYISPDLDLAIFPAGGLNELGSAAPGVCISTDKGQTFFDVPFAGLNLDATSPGPLAVSCLDKNRCFAFSGLPFQDGTTYLYYSTDASMGKASTWTRATLPAAIANSGNGFPRFVFFAPDGLHGWLAGADDTSPMLLRTTDGGHTFTDISGQIRTVTDQRIHSGFALDNDHIWLGGENGTLLFTDTAQQ